MEWAGSTDHDSVYYDYLVHQYKYNNIHNIAGTNNNDFIYSTIHHNNHAAHDNIVVHDNNIHDARIHNINFDFIYNNPSQHHDHNSVKHNHISCRYHDNDIHNNRTKSDNNSTTFASNRND